MSRPPSDDWPEGDDPTWTLRERLLVDYLRSTEGGGHRIGPGAQVPTGRWYDAVVDGVATEFKTPDVGADSGTMRNRAADSRRRGGQARLLIFDLREARTPETEARRGVRRIRGAYSKCYDGVRVVGRTYDFTEEFR